MRIEDIGYYLTRGGLEDFVNSVNPKSNHRYNVKGYIYTPRVCVDGIVRLVREWDQWSVGGKVEPRGGEDGWAESERDIVSLYPC
jgi:hypothetical protein